MRETAGKSWTLITGTSRGIGRGVAQALVKLGHSVVVTARDAKAAQALAGELGPRAMGLGLDVTQPAQVGAVVAALQRSGIALNALVHNGAIYVRGASGAGVEETVATNVLGPIALTSALAPVLAADARVVIVSSNLSSLESCSSRVRTRIEALDRTDAIEAFAREYLTADGAAVRRELDAYCFSKAMVNRLAVAWSRQAPKRTSVAVSPGWVRTEMGGAGAPNPVSYGIQRVVAATVGEVTSGTYYPDGVITPRLPDVTLPVGM